MTPDQPSFDCAAAAELHAAAALGALDPDERLAYAAHVADCANCQAERAAYERVSTLLATSAPAVTPPAALRDRILAIARAERALGDPPRRRWPFAGWTRREVATLAAGVIMAVLGLSWGAIEMTEADGQRRYATEMHRRVDAHNSAWLLMVRHDMDGHELRPDGGGNATGRVYFDRQSNSAILVVSELPRLPSDRVYQVWLVAGAARDSAGVFRTDEGGFGWLTIDAPSRLDQYDSVGVTSEPLGGSLEPTGVRVLATTLQ